MPPKKAATTPKEAPAKKTPARAAAKPKKYADDEEDFEDDDEYEPKPKSAAGRKKTPAKPAAKPAGKAKKPASEEEEDEDEVDEEDSEDEEFDEEEEEDEDFNDGKPKKTLFIKNLPSSTTEADIKALSPEIQDVRMDVSKNPSEKNPKYAILDFKDQASAEKTLAVLKGASVNGVEIIADYVGGKSIITYVKPTLTPSSDPLKLYVTGFGRDISIEKLNEMFPTASDVTLPLNEKDNNKPVGYAFIHYTDEAVCKEAHDKMQDYSYQGRTLVVMYGKKTTPESEQQKADEAKRKAAAAPKGTPPAKKSKKQAAEEEEEEEEEEEDLEDEGDEEEDGEGEEEEDDEDKGESNGDN